MKLAHSIVVYVGVDITITIKTNSVEQARLAVIVVVVVFVGIVIVEMCTLFTLCNYCHSDGQARATGTRWCGSLEAGWWLGRTVGGTVGGPPLTLWGTGGDLWGPTGGTRAHLLNLQRPTATLTLNSRTLLLRRCTVPTLVLPNLHQTTCVNEVFANIRRKSTKAGLPIQRT